MLLDRKDVWPMHCVMIKSWKDWWVVLSCGVGLVPPADIFAVDVLWFSSFQLLSKSGLGEGVLRVWGTVGESQGYQQDWELPHKISCPILFIEVRVLDVIRRVLYWCHIRSHSFAISSTFIQTEVLTRQITGCISYFWFCVLKNLK